MGVGAPQDNSSNSTFGSSTCISIGGLTAAPLAEYFFVTATWSASGLIEQTERFRSDFKNRVYLADDKYMETAEAEFKSLKIKRNDSCTKTSLPFPKMFMLPILELGADPFGQNITPFSFSEVLSLD